MRRFRSPSADSGSRLYCILMRPFAAAWHDPGPDRGPLHVSGIGDCGSWWTCWSDTFWLERWSISLQPPPSLLPLSPSRPSRTCFRVGPPATGSGPTRPAGHAVAGCRPPYPCRIRVERAATRALGCRRPGGSLPHRQAQSWGRSALPARDGWSEHHQGASG